MGHSYKFTIFILISAVIHLLLFLFSFTNLPASNLVQQVAIGLVQRPFQQFNPHMKISEKSETPKALSLPAAEFAKQTTVDAQKQQLPLAKMPASKVHRNTADKVLTTEPEPISAGVYQQPQTPVVEKKSLSEPPEHPEKVTEMTPAIAASGDLKHELEVNEGAYSTNAELAGLGSTTTTAVALPATQGFQDALPRYAQNPSPSYPEVSRRRGQEGTVLLEVAVRADGLVEKLAVTKSSGYKQLDSAALSAVRRWQFRPATSLGLPVSSRVVIPVDFVLQEEN